VPGCERNQRVNPSSATVLSGQTYFSIVAVMLKNSAIQFSSAISAQRGDRFKNPGLDTTSNQRVKQTQIVR